MKNLKAQKENGLGLPRTTSQNKSSEPHAKTLIKSFFNSQRTLKSGAGFTLIEILVVIGIIAILATIVIIAINPARQFAQSRNTQRTANVQAILNAIGQRIADNKGLFRQSTDATCTAAMDITSASTTITSTAGAGNLDLRPCLVPTYISELPVDPKVGTAFSGGAYNTGYQVSKDSSGRMVVCAPDAANEGSLSPALAICIVR